MVGAAQGDSQPDLVRWGLSRRVKVAMASSTAAYLLTTVVVLLLIDTRPWWLTLSFWLAIHCSVPLTFSAYWSQCLAIGPDGLRWTVGRGGVIAWRDIESITDRHVQASVIRDIDPDTGVQYSRDAHVRSLSPRRRRRPLRRFLDPQRRNEFHTLIELHRPDLAGGDRSTVTRPGRRGRRVC